MSAYQFACVLMFYVLVSNEIECDVLHSLTRTCGSHKRFVLSAEYECQLVLLSV